MDGWMIEETEQEKNPRRLKKKNEEEGGRKFGQDGD